uniref:Uncharacterized protein n=1 Tax=Arundo donax TaxID=35708 RepID=A0A0A9GQ38_ARUDO
MHFLVNKTRPMWQILISNSYKVVKLIMKKNLALLQVRRCILHP